MQYSPANSKTQAEMKQLVVQLLADAKRVGATEAEVSIHTACGFSVQVRNDAVETVEHHRGKGLGLSVYFGHRTGSANTSDLSPKALQATLEKACNIARFTGEDPCAGLAPPEFMAYQYPDLDLYHVWNITPEQAIDLARECESLAKATDSRISNSEGAYVNTHSGWEVYGNSHGFIGDYLSSSHRISCTLIAEDAQGMQCDSDYTVARDPMDLLNIPTVARSAALNTVRRLGVRPLKTMKTPIIFAPHLAKGLIGNFLAAISGGNLYRKSSFLLDHLHKPVFPEFVQIKELPHLLKGLASAPFDAEGVRTQGCELVRDGTLQSYLLGSYSARKLGMQTTGNAGGAHNVFISSSDYDLHDLMKNMGTGLFVTDLMGQGINLVTGNYSRGAFGFWVENGEIQHPVQEITIAGNLKEMFMNIVAIGKDIDNRGNIHTGSIWIDPMTVAGNS